MNEPGDPFPSSKQLQLYTSIPAAGLASSVSI